MSHIPVSMATIDATSNFTPLPCCPLWSKHWGWKNT